MTTTDNTLLVSESGPDATADANSDEPAAHDFREMFYGAQPVNSITKSNPQLALNTSSWNKEFLSKLPNTSFQHMFDDNER